MKITHLSRFVAARFIAVAAALLLLVGFPALDWVNRGMVYQTLERLTGEETLPAQARGFVEWLGNFTREQPQTAPDVPVNHAGVNPFGVNTFLEAEVEPAKREQQMQMIADAGFAWIRQQFVWQDIEIAGRDDFTDRRNDLNGDGQIDEISAWAKYDSIVALAEQYGIGIMARLDNPPAWSQVGSAEGDFAPPADYDDFANFAATVAERYRGRIRYYQVWNEPNIYPEWGEQSVSAAGYTDLLCRAYRALKAVDPSIVVISGALSPTLSLTGRDLNEFIFLQQMYDAGAGDCFDVLSVQGYGFFSGPTDQRMRPFTFTFARHLYVRDIMVANGDADKAVWISEAAWNPIDSPDVPADVQARENYGTVTQEQAARYMPLAYQRAQEEWPWVGMISYWFFKQPDDSRRNHSSYYFRMLEPDFTPLPVYGSMRDFIREYQPTLYPGVHQHDDWAISLTDAQPQTADGAQFGDAAAVSSAEFRAQGSEAVIRWRPVEDGGALTVTRNGDTRRIGGNADVWNETRFRIEDGDIIRLNAGAGAFLLDSITVVQAQPNPTPLLIAASLIALLLAFGLRLVLRRSTTPTLPDQGSRVSR